MSKIIFKLNTIDSIRQKYIIMPEEKAYEIDIFTACALKVRCKVGKVHPLSESGDGS